MGQFLVNQTKNPQSTGCTVVAMRIDQSTSRPKQPLLFQNLPLTGLTAHRPQKTMCPFGSSEPDLFQNSLTLLPPNGSKPPFPVPPQTPPSQGGHALAVQDRPFSFPCQPKRSLLQRPRNGFQGSLFLMPPPPKSQNRNTLFQEQFLDKVLHLAPPLPLNPKPSFPPVLLMSISCKKL